MSRRLRKEEQERLQSTKKEFLEQDQLKLRKERILAPVVWRTIANGRYKVIDLQEKYHDETLFIIKEYYIPNDVITRNAQIIDDDVSLNSLLTKAKYFLKDCTSLAIVEEAVAPPETGEDDEEEENKGDGEETDAPQPVVTTLAGVLVMKAVHKSDYGPTFNSVVMTDGETQRKCINFYSAINRGANVMETMNCESYLHYYYLCIKPEYRHRGLAYKLMISALDVARSLHMTVVAGLFPSYVLQKLAKKMGMKVIHEIAYVEWRDKNGDIIFDDPGAGNYTCAMMARHVPAETIPEPIDRTVVVEVREPRMTRAQKRETLAKAQSKNAPQSPPSPPPQTSAIN